jgi:hypothetical protein
MTLTSTATADGVLHAASYYEVTVAGAVGAQESSSTEQQHQLVPYTGRYLLTPLTLGSKRQLVTVYDGSRSRTGCCPRRPFGDTLAPWAVMSFPRATVYFL